MMLQEVDEPMSERNWSLLLEMSRFPTCKPQRGVDVSGQQSNRAKTGTELPAGWSRVVGARCPGSLGDLTSSQEMHLHYPNPRGGLCTLSTVDEAVSCANQAGNYRTR